MSIAQLKSINERKLKTRAEAYSRTRIVCNRPADASEKAWMAGYMAALEDVRQRLDKAGGALLIAEWLEGQPTGSRLEGQP